MPRGSVRADADLDEGRLGHGRRDRAAAYVDHDLVTQADRTVAEGERDALLQGGAEGAGRDLADDVAVGIDKASEYFANAENPVSPRPTYSALDLSKIEATGLNVPDWEESLKTYVAKELDR